VGKFVKDPLNQLADPIVIEAGVLSDKEYRLEKITMGMTEELAKLASSQEKNFDVLSKQLGIIFGVDPKEFYDVDVRVLFKVTQWINKEIEDAIYGKNV
jgi:hypothetical protein